MSRTVRATAALIATLSLLAGCGEGDEGSSESAPAAASDSASALTITCFEDTTEVDTSTVSAGPSGLSVRIEDGSGIGLVALMENETTGVGAYVEQDDATVEVAPGGYAIRCVDMDEPEHMEPASGNPESQNVEVLASADNWTPEGNLSCNERMSSVRDFAAMPEADPQFRSRPVEPVVRADREVSGWMLDDDELVTTGYRDSAGRRVEVIRSGEVVGVVSLFLGPEGWLIGSTEACSNP